MKIDFKTHLAQFIAMCANGLAFMLSWNWFVATAFNVPTVTYLQAFGLAYFVAYLRFREVDKEKYTVFQDANSTTAAYLVYILVCTIIHFSQLALS